MRRTLEEAVRLLAVSGGNEEEISHCIWELSEIVPTIEAMQMAVREGGYSGE